MTIRGKQRWLQVGNCRTLSIHRFSCLGGRRYRNWRKAAAYSCKVAAAPWWSPGPRQGQSPGDSRFTRKPRLQEISGRGATGGGHESKWDAEYGGASGLSAGFPAHATLLLVRGCFSEEERGGDVQALGQRDQFKVRHVAFPAFDLGNRGTTDRQARRHQTIRESHLGKTHAGSLPRLPHTRSDQVFRNSVWRVRHHA